MLAEILSVAKSAAQAGGEVVARYYREGVTMRSKQSFNLVSDADVESEQAIVAVIRKQFPDHAVLAEEQHQGDVLSEHLWIIDPLDGTNNFAHQVPQFAISVAYVHRGVTQVGVVYQPLRDEWYTAVRGKGAFFNSNRAQVANHLQLSESLVGVGFYYDRGALMEATLAAIGDLFRQQIHGIRRFGAASLDLCYVGLGMFGTFFEYELAPWDYAAGALFIEEAGGRVTTCYGTPVPWAKSSLLASNGTLHSAVLALVQPHLERIRPGP